MNKGKLVKVILPFVFGVCFMTAGLCLFGIINNGASLGEGLSNPAYWIYGVLFGVILALGAAWKGKTGKTKTI